MHDKLTDYRDEMHNNLARDAGCWASRIRKLIPMRTSRLSRLQDKLAKNAETRGLSDALGDLQIPPSIGACESAGSAEPTGPPKRLLDPVRDAICISHYSYKTEESYLGWIRRYILFHGKRHPREFGGAEGAAFVSGLAT